MTLLEIKPTLDQIKNKIQAGGVVAHEENQFYELKTPTNGLPDTDDFIAAVVSFYNTLGGYIIIFTGDLQKTEMWCSERQWENTTQWKNNHLERINNKITPGGEYRYDGNDFVVLDVSRADEPFDFVSINQKIYLRTGARTKKVGFDEGETGLLKEVMKRRLISNGLRNAAKFWRDFYRDCFIIFSNPALLDNSTPNLLDNPTVKKIRSIGINSKDTETLKELHDMSIKLSAPGHVVSTLNELISANEAISKRQGVYGHTYGMYQLIQMYKNRISDSEQTQNIKETGDWLESIRAGA